MMTDSDRLVKDSGSSDFSAAEAAAFDLLPDPVCVISPDGRPVHFNSAWRSFNGEHFASPSWTEHVDPDDRGLVEETQASAFRHVRDEDVDIRVTDQREDEHWFRLKICPRSDADGRLRFFLFLLTDIHDRKMRTLHLSRQAELRSAMLDVSPDCIKILSHQGILLHMNRAGCVALNVSETSGFGMPWLPLLPEGIHEQGQEALDIAGTGEHSRFFGESRTGGEDPRYWDNMLTPLLRRDGTVEAILCVSRDVTMQHVNEQWIQLLLRELNHRSKNMLSVIQALIRRTLPDTHNASVRTLLDRISSIARSQDILLHGAWEGAAVQEVVISQTAIAGEAHGKQLCFSGDTDLRLSPESAERLGLALHELTTNAIRHGALSVMTGKVCVSWGTEGEDFFLKWVERGGPPASAMAKPGFGTVIIERNPLTITASRVSYSRGEEGVTWEFYAPAHMVLREPEEHDEVSADGVPADVRNA